MPKCMGSADSLNEPGFPEIESGFRNIRNTLNYSNLPGCCNFAMMHPASNRSSLNCKDTDKFMGNRKCQPLVIRTSQKKIGQILY